MPDWEGTTSVFFEKAYNDERPRGGVQRHGGRDSHRRDADRGPAGVDGGRPRRGLGGGGGVGDDVREGSARALQSGGYTMVVVDLRTHGKSTSSIAAGKRSINNWLNDNILKLAYDNDSGDNSPQFVGVKTCAAPSVADEALAKNLDSVRKRAGELVFSASSSPGTAAKAGELYKRIVHGNEVITSIVRDFPDKLSQEVVTMSMTLMSPPERKR